ncbi:MAG TPA: phospholipid carrier-dependent glycosyltransferase [Thermomicrobiales bacterium]|jgi:hypothetical protein
MNNPRTITIPDGVPRRLAGTVRRRLHLILFLGVFALGLWQNLAAIDSSQFHPDESRWLNRAHYLRDLAHPLSDVWEDRYLTRGQPPMGSYLTGIGLLLQGRDLTTNGPWDFHFGNESSTTWNAIKGNMPAPADIEAARRTNAVVGALSCAVLFLIVARLANAFGGVIAGVFLAFHPLQIYLASIGVSDAVFTLFMALAALAGLALARAPTWPRALALGVVLGCGASTKLSPLFVSLPLAGLGVVILFDPLLRRLPVVGRLWRAVSRVEVGSKQRLGWMLIAQPAITAATFVLSYPYLWPDPLGRTLKLLDFRQSEMDNQARIWPTTAINSRVEAVRRTWENLENLYSSSGRGIAFVGRALGRQWAPHGVDLPFAVVGLAMLVWLAWRQGIASPPALTLAVIGVQSAVILAGLGVDFNRYYLPFVFASGVGIGILGSRVGTIVASLYGRWHLALPRPVVRPAPRGAAMPSRAAGQSRPADR